MGIQTNIGNPIQPITGISKGIDINGSDFSIDIPTNADALNQTTNTSTSGSNISGIASAGMDVLTSIPALVANSKIKPEEIGNTREEVKSLVKAKTANYATSGMKIGGQIGSIFGPIGSLIGSFAGGLGGYAAGRSQDGVAINQFNKDQNKETTDEWTSNEEERSQNYFDSVTAENMKAELKLMKQQKGFIT